MERSFVSGYKPYVKRHNFPRVRCSFWMLTWANGCFYDCAYCWLKAGYHPWSWTEIHIAERAPIARCLRRFCKRISGSQLLNAGELCDSFVAPEYIPFMASELKRANEEYGRWHRLLLLTKSADPSVLLNEDLSDVVVYSLSVNAEQPARNLERGASPPGSRMRAALKVGEAGYEVRVRVDPIIAGYEDEYPVLMQHVCSRLQPSVVTLGSLRATPRTWRFLPETIRTQLTEKTPWGRGYPLETRLSIYSELVTVAKEYGVPVALCKEPLDVWKKLGLKGPCNCMPRLDKKAEECES